MNYRFYKREFLNHPGHHTVGFIFAAIEETTVEKNWSGDVDLIMADCSRQINLSFPLDEPEDRVNSLHKLDLIINTLQEFREAFVVECAIQEKRDEIKSSKTLDKDGE